MTRNASQIPFKKDSSKNQTFTLILQNNSEIHCMNNDKNHQDVSVVADQHENLMKCHFGHG